MKTHEWGWSNGEGLAFQSRSWEPEGGRRGVLVLLHGLGEHTGRYEAVGRRLAESHYALAGFDMRGHGLSAGPRGHTPGYDVLLDDVGHPRTNADPGSAAAAVETGTAILLEVFAGSTFLS
ncbi:MAG: alpha/beta hydrolase, partial [Anaerolineales bacterium]